MNCSSTFFTRVLVLPGLALTTLLCSPLVAQTSQQGLDGGAASTSARLQTVVPSARRNGTATLQTQSTTPGPTSRLQSVAPMLAQNTPRPIPPQRPGIPLQGGPQLRRPVGQGLPNAAVPSGPAIPGTNPNAIPPSFPPAVKPGGSTLPATTAAKTGGDKPAADDDGMFELQFPNAPLPDILYFYESLTGKKIIRDTNAEAATITIETTGKMTKEDAIEFMEKTLLLNG